MESKSYKHHKTAQFHKNSICSGWGDVLTLISHTFPNPDLCVQFIEKTLQQGGMGRTKGARFHFKDAHISVEDLLDTWHHSEVYHWTSDDVVKWLTDSVGLPHYEGRFRDLGYNGTILPW